jgi:hypothetical protein
VAFLNHDSRSWPIGTWDNVEKMLRGRPPAWRAISPAQIRRADPEVDQAAWMIENGYMRPVRSALSRIGTRSRRSSTPRASGPAGCSSTSRDRRVLLCGVPANPEALAKSIEGNVAFAREAIEQVLDNWARDADGKLIERTAFEDLYRLAAKEEDVRASIEEYLAKLGPRQRRPSAKNSSPQRESILDAGERSRRRRSRHMPRARLEALERGEKTAPCRKARSRTRSYSRARRPLTHRSPLIGGYPPGHPGATPDPLGDAAAAWMAKAVLPAPMGQF